MELLLLGLLAMGILGGSVSVRPESVGNVRQNDAGIMIVLAIMSTSTDRGILDP